MDTEPTFSNLYEYVTKNGIVLPQTSDIKTQVEEYFKHIFGGDFSVDPETPEGRMIEAITMLLVDVLGVNAQNANSINPYQAVGYYLDNIGEVFGVSRLAGESDDSYRKRIVGGQSLGKGFPESIVRAISQVTGVTSVCVLNNGEEDPAVLPNADVGMAVDAHSVFICVGGGNDEDVAQAINDSISAGCGFSDSEQGTEVNVTVSDSETGTQNNIKFYRPETVELVISCNIVNVNYSGEDIVSDVKQAIADYIAKNNTQVNLNDASIITAIAIANLGVVSTSATIQVKNDNNGLSDAPTGVKIYPSQQAVIDTDDITVNLR